MRDWVVVFQNKNTGKVAFDVFTEVTPELARKAFRVCYRHEDYRILTVVEKPEVEGA